MMTINQKKRTNDINKYLSVATSPPKNLSNNLNTLSYSEMFFDSQRGVIPVRRTEAAARSFCAL